MENKTKVLLLSNNDNANVLAERLGGVDCDVKLFHDKITVEIVKELDPDMVVSYNYSHIVKEDVIDFLGNKIINMHVSFLPWNKGASPNIWSFIDDTPKGVTIHRLEKGLDTGKIIVQREVEFDEDKDTLSSSYQRLQEEIVDLLMENWNYIKDGNYELKEQVGSGSYHRTADLNKILGNQHIDYNMTIAEFKTFIKGLMT